MDESIADKTTTKPRRPWLAAMLSLLGGGPIGQAYAGSLRRCVCLWLVGASLLPLLMLAAIVNPLGRAGLLALMIGGVAFPILLAIDAFVLARRNRYVPLKNYQRWWMYAVLFSFFLLTNNAVPYVVRSILGEAFAISSRGMSPTILAGDRILVDRLGYRWNPVQRNDLIVFRSRGAGSPLFVMRVVGLAGDTIEVKNERVHIDGAAWEDSHEVLDPSLPVLAELANYGPEQVPPDHFFVLGDNRRRSYDSRMLGPIPLSDVHGKARLIYWSREHVFPDPTDNSRFSSGPIHWDRIGQRLD